MTAGVPSASRDLAFLKAAGAVRRVDEEEGGFLLELADRKLLALPPESVAAFKAGVLLGWRLPRERQGSS